MNFFKAAGSTKDSDSPSNERSQELQQFEVPQDVHGGSYGSRFSSTQTFDNPSSSLPDSDLSDSLSTPDQEVMNKHRYSESLNQHLTENDEEEEDQHMNKRRKLSMES
jgi:hypothetical protein